jgi:phosphate transport system protein
VTVENAHIHAAFDRDLETIQAEVMKMGGMVETAIAEAAKALELRDEDSRRTGVANDLQIDALELQIDEEVARVIALRQPIATDLRTVLTVMKISANLERVGDYAKNMAKRTSALVEMQPIEGAAGALRRQAKAVELMLRTRSTPIFAAMWIWHMTCASATARSTRCTTRCSANS